MSDTWFLSGSAAQDVAMFVMADQSIGNRTLRIGEVTGYLGLWLNALRDNDVTMLGYPANLDAGQLMEFTTAHAFQDNSASNNTVIYGSAMSHGASGGPWIQDFGIAPVWTPNVSDPSLPMGQNLVVAVTSFGPCDQGVYCPPKWLGASILDDRTYDMWTKACGFDAKDCAP